MKCGNPICFFQGELNLFLVGRDTMFLVSYCLLIYIYELFMIFVFIVCYVKSRVCFCLLVFSTHAFMCLLSVSGNIQVDSIMLLSTLATDRQQLGWIFCVGLYFFVMGCFYVNFEHFVQFVFCHEFPNGEFVRF